MNLECFTARELADAINELGYKAKIVIEDGKTYIESASSGVSWSVWLGLDDPFFDVMQHQFVCIVYGLLYVFVDVKLM